MAIKDGKLKVKPFTKSEAGMRVVDIPQRLANFLADERKKAYSSPTISPLVCPSAGAWISYERYSMAAIMEKLFAQPELEVWASY